MSMTKSGQGTLGAAGLGYRTPVASEIVFCDEGGLAQLPGCFGG